MNRNWVLLLLIAAACSDPVAPVLQEKEDFCENVFACRASGIDVGVVAVTLSGAERHPETGRPVLDPDSVPVKIVLRNFGTLPQSSFSLWAAVRGNRSRTGFDDVGLTVPSLDPGESVTIDTTIAFPRSGSSDLTDDRVYVHFDTYEDQHSSNNSFNSEIFHLGVPLLQFTVNTVGEAAIGDSIPLRITLSNYSSVKTSSATTASVCLELLFDGCTPQYRTTLGTIAQPAVPPRAVVEYETRAKIPPSSVSQDLASTYSVVMCPSEPALPNYVSETAICWGTTRAIFVRPNYETNCAPPVLTNNVAANLPAYNCGIRPTVAGHEAATKLSLFHIVALDATAGVTYTVTSNNQAPLRLYTANGIAAVDEDPALNRIRVPFSERVYLISYSTSDAVSITATQVSP